ncbi:LOW QUALITY PROTEIN: adhesive plaque matrix protein-like [Scylla paramamosain]|uniref:LOW QUALITY PROTEIN: adhesive plaque matrix protein-like n=1 Tax=Scylla paramamosain TaxID=85552 RepID=UPI003083D53E
MKVSIVYKPKHGSRPPLVYLPLPCIPQHSPHTTPTHPEMLRVAAAVLLLSFSASVQAEADAKPDYPAAGPPTSYGPPPAPAPSYGPPPAPAPSYGPPPAPSYGPPPKPKSYCHKKCYDKTVYTTITKTAKEHHTSWMTENQYVPTTLYKYVTEKLYYPTTVVQYEFVTQPLPDQVVYETKVAYNHATITEAHITTVQDMMPGTHYYLKTHTESHYCTSTVQVPYYVTVTQHVYKTVQEPHYVTETKVEQNYVTVTEDEPHYVTQTQYETKHQYMYVTVTETKHGYVTVTNTKTEPMYTTVCKYGY